LGYQIVKPGKNAFRSATGIPGQPPDNSFNNTLIFFFKKHLHDTLPVCTFTLRFFGVIFLTAGCYHPAVFFLPILPLQNTTSYFATTPAGMGFLFFCFIFLQP
jgi:hypothetical protein